MATAAAPTVAVDAEGSSPGLRSLPRSGRMSSPPGNGPDPPDGLGNDDQWEGSGFPTGSGEPAAVDALVVTAFAAVTVVDGRERSAGRLADASAVPAGLRRRLRGTNLVAVRAGLGCLAQATKPVELVFCSRHGDLPRTQRLLLTIAGLRPPSPLEFPLSVHNAVAGMLDVARGERTGHTSIAAGSHSFTAALIEIWIRLRVHPDRAMLLLYLEHDLPQELHDRVDESLGGTVLAALLETSGGNDRTLAHLRRVSPATAAEGDAEAEARSMISVLEGGSAVRLAGRAGFDWLVEPAG
jgi:hypothetical protein